ncbi:hypothetical protein CR513_16784, partial [Mucuna pruriens]
MECLQASYLIKIPSLHLIFGKAYIKPWELDQENPRQYENFSKSIKSYTNKKRRMLEFEEVTPTTRIGRVIKSKKLTLKFIGPNQILRIPEIMHIPKGEQLRGKEINLVKVVRSNATINTTWELEDKMQEQHPQLFFQ